MNKGKQPPPVDNSVSDSTGQYDLRFLLWRQFCARYQIPVDTLPSQLNDRQKELWEDMGGTRRAGLARQTFECDHARAWFMGVYRRAAAQP